MIKEYQITTSQGLRATLLLHYTEEEKENLDKKAQALINVAVDQLKKNPETEFQRYQRSIRTGVFGAFNAALSSGNNLKDMALAIQIKAVDENQDYLYIAGMGNIKVEVYDRKQDKLITSLQAENGTPLPQLHRINRYTEIRSFILSSQPSAFKKIGYSLLTPKFASNFIRKKSLGLLLASTTSLGLGAGLIAFASVIACSTSAAASLAAGGAFLALLVTNWPVLLTAGAVILTIGGVGLYCNKGNVVLKSTTAKQDEPGSLSVGGGNNP